MSDVPMTACERFSHAWYVRAFGGVQCGRCGLRSQHFCVVGGVPEVHDHDQEVAR